MAMSDAITPELVRHIAQLSRLKLTPDELEAITRDLDAIVGYVDQLKDVDVEGVEPTAHAVAMTNVLRDDQVQPSIAPEAAIANAPDRERTFFKVPKVLDQDSA